MAAEAMVFVDENGNVISQDLASPYPRNSALPSFTSLATGPATSSVISTPATTTEALVFASMPAKNSNYVASVDTTTMKVASTSSTSTAPETQGLPGAVASPNFDTSTSEWSQSHTDASDTNSKPSTYGIGWSGYKGDTSNATCKTAEDADHEWSQMQDYAIVRVYGTDCVQPYNAVQLAKKYNKKVFMGIYFLDDTMSNEVQSIIDAIQSSGARWDHIDTVSIGNEDVHRGEKTVDEIFDAITSARQQLQAAGYTGPIVHVDSQDAILANPELCGQSAGDYIAANIHPFFNPQTCAEQAGEFVQSQIDLLRQCGSTQGHRRDAIRVRVTETGWPKNGSTNGAAVPSKLNQGIAMNSIKSKIASDVIVFSAFNNYWMLDDPTTFDTEHYWGLLDD